MGVVDAEMGGRKDSLVKVTDKGKAQWRFARHGHNFCVMVEKGVIKRKEGNKFENVL